ncbi:MAG: cation diffusion facilitator family transporter [Candidatus Omnitrophota bacterium]
MTVIHHRNINKISRLKLALFLTAGGMVLEFVGGFISNSLALTSDAWHMLTHLFALSMTYFAIILSSRSATKKHTYGFYRTEILVAFINGIVLIFIAGYLVYESVLRFLSPQDIKISEMLLIAGIGLVINGITTVFLFQAGSHDLNIRSAILHEIGDLVSSIAIVIASLIILFTKNYIFDPILAIFISILIVIWAIKLIVDSAGILLEFTPKHLDIDEVIAVLKNEIKGIYEVHHVHAWTIASGIYAFTAHIVIDDCHISKANEVLHEVNRLVKERFHIGHTNIQFECLVKK